MAGNGNLVNNLGGNVGFGENILDRNDDESTSSIDITSIFSQGLNYFGQNYNNLYVNNNGNITFGSALDIYTPFGISGSTIPIIAAYFADVDTRGDTVSSDDIGNSKGTNLVYYDFDKTNQIFTVTYDDVGYYDMAKDKTNTFQIQLTNQGNGDFDITFRYEDINWTTGDASNGSGGLGGDVSRAGYSSGDCFNFFELPQSGNQDQMLLLEDKVGNSGEIGKLASQ